MRWSGHIRERSHASFELRYSLGTDPAAGKRNIAIDTPPTKVGPKDEPIPPADDCEFRLAIRPRTANRCSPWQVLL
jgi:hypothetical protein